MGVGDGANLVVFGQNGSLPAHSPEGLLAGPA